MKKRIFLFGLISVCLALVASGVVSMIFFTQHQVETAREFLRTEIAAFETFLERGDESARIEILKPALRDSRLTIFELDGETPYIVADSRVGNIDPPVCHELTAALKYPYGEESRYSNVLGENELYIAKQTAGNRMIRMSMPMSQVYNDIFGELVTLIVAFIAAVFVFLLFCTKAIPRLMRPVEYLHSMYKHTGDTYEAASEEAIAYDDDLRPIARDINKLVTRLNEHIDSIKLQGQKMQVILDMMDEGLIQLDADQKIIYINRKARIFFGIAEHEEPETLLMVTHNTKIREEIDRAHRRGTKRVFDLADMIFHDKTLRLTIRPVPSDGGAGTLILVTDITELLKAEQIRSEFTANVTYEVGTPINEIKKLTTALSEDKDAGRGAVVRYLAMVNIEADRLLNLIEDVFIISELEFQRAADQDAVTDVKPVAERIIQKLTPKAEQNRVNMTLTCSDAQVMMEPKRFNDMLYNLVDNAIKYNVPDGKVTVNINNDGQRLHISVADTGRGIPQSEQPRVFERFFRSQKDRPDVQGTGLGLSIVKHTAMMHGGMVELKSEPGEGTEIIVTLPLADGQIPEK